MKLAILQTLFGVAHALHGCGPAMGGADMIEFHRLAPTDDGVIGDPTIQYNYTAMDMTDKSEIGNYTFYFKSEENKAKFAAAPRLFLPQFGGF